MLLVTSALVQLPIASNIFFGFGVANKPPDAILHTMRMYWPSVNPQAMLNLVGALSLKQRLLLVATVELAYWTATRITLQFFQWDTIDAESIRLALRVASATVDWWLCRELIRSRVPVASNFRRPSLLFSVTLFLLASATTKHPELQPSFAIVFGLGSIAVGLKEEFLFRGIVQNLLHSRFGHAKSVLITSIAFTAWHYGVVSNSAWTFIQIFLASAILGLIYVRTGSIWTVALLHALYDAMFALPNWIPTLHGNSYAFLELLGAAALLVFL